LESVSKHGGGVMEKLYRKKDNGRYEVASYTWPDSEYLPGLWLIQGDKRPTSFKNVGYYVAKLPDPVNVQKWLEIAMNEDVLINALVDSGAKFYEVSAHDVAHAIIRQVYNKEDLV